MLQFLYLWFLSFSIVFVLWRDFCKEYVNLKISRTSSNNCCKIVRKIGFNELTHWNIFKSMKISRTWRKYHILIWIIIFFSIFYSYCNSTIIRNSSKFVLLFKILFSNSTCWERKLFCSCLVQYKHTIVKNRDRAKLLTLSRIMRRVQTYATSWARA